MKKVFILFIVLSIVSCKNTNNTTTNEIIAFMIDKKARPLPPPPPINDTTTTVISKKVMDSLFKIKLKVAVYPKLEELSKASLRHKLSDRYNKIFKDSILKPISIDLNGIYSNKGHNIMLADTIALKKHQSYDSFDLLFWFSNFYFSEDKQKVFFTLGISRDYLNGYSALYVLKKEENTWVTEYYKNLEIW